MQTIYKTIGAVILFAYILNIILGFTVLPEMHKSIRLVATLYLISIIIRPLNIDTFDIPLSDIDYMDYSADSTVLDMANDKITNEIKLLFESKNISYNDVCVHIIESEKGIYINDITIKTHDNHNNEQIEELLKGYSDVIIFEE